MNKNPKTTQLGGNLRTNFNKLLAFVGIGWLTSMVVIRYVIKPWKVETRLKQNESIMNKLYDEQVQQENAREKFEI